MHELQGIITWRKILPLTLKASGCEQITVWKYLLCYVLNTCGLHNTCEEITGSLSSRALLVQLNRTNSTSQLNWYLCLGKLYLGLQVGFTPLFSPVLGTTGGIYTTLFPCTLLYEICLHLAQMHWYAIAQEQTKRRDRSFYGVVSTIVSRCHLDLFRETKTYWLLKAVRMR